MRIINNLLVRTMNTDYRREELEQLYAGVLVSSADTVLDALCGNGFASRSLIERIEKIVGIDSKERPKDFPQEIAYSQQAIQQLDFADGTFSLALAHTGFHHVGQGNPTEQQQAVKELYRVLRFGGVLRLSDLEGNTSASRLNDEYTPNHGERCVWLTPEYTCTLLKNAGFDDIKAESVSIHWRFEDHSQLEQVAKSVFKVDSKTLEEYRLVNDLTITLPFVYARGVKK
jgi:SAM-dependent methyltransferase